MSALDDARLAAMAAFVNKASQNDMEMAYWRLIAAGGASAKPPVISTKTASYVMTVNDSTVLVDASSGGVTITLPPAASSFNSSTQVGQRYSIKKVDPSANTVTIKGNGSETIDGTNMMIDGNQYDCTTVQSNGTTYYVISRS